MHASVQRISPDLVPAHIAPELVVEFDYLNDPGFRTSPHEVYMRFSGGPDMIYSICNGGHWIATRLEVMNDIFLDPAHFSNFPRIIPKAVSLGTPQPFSDIDPPHNAKYRRLLTAALGKKGARDFADEARRIMIELTDEVLPFGACDFAAAIAQKLPIFVLMRWLDLPFEDRFVLMKHTDEILGHHDPAARKVAKLATRAYVESVVTERRAHPAADFISYLANGEIDGRRATHEEAVAMVTNLLIGGLDTVRHMMSFIALFLARNVGHRRQLVESPNLLPAAVDEMLRWAPIPNMSRSVTGDFSFHGVQLKAGEMVLMPLVLAGRDERAYENAARVDFTRPRARTLTFGTGGHVCPGMNLAKIELAIFLEEWLKRVPEFWLPPDKAPVTRGGIILGVEELPLAWPC
jgi:cytochrome P450